MLPHLRRVHGSVSAYAGHTRLSRPQTKSCSADVLASRPCPFTFCAPLPSSVYFLFGTTLCIPAGGFSAGGLRTLGSTFVNVPMSQGPAKDGPPSLKPFVYSSLQREEGWRTGKDVRTKRLRTKQRVKCIRAMIVRSEHRGIEPITDDENAPTAMTRMALPRPSLPPLPPITHERRRSMFLAQKLGGPSAKTFFGRLMKECSPSAVLVYQSLIVGT